MNSMRYFADHLITTRCPRCPLASKKELNDEDGLTCRRLASLLQVHDHHLEELLKSCVQLRVLLFNDAHLARGLVVPSAAWQADTMRIAVLILVEAKDNEVPLSRAPQGLHELYPR